MTNYFLSLKFVINKRFSYSETN